MHAWVLLPETLSQIYFHVVERSDEGISRVQAQERRRRVHVQTS